MTEKYKMLDRFDQDEARSCFHGGIFNPADFNDGFLRMVYDYHRKGGLRRMFFKGLGEVIIYLFIVFVGIPSLSLGVLLYLDPSRFRLPDGTAHGGALEHLARNLLEFYARYAAVYILLGAYGVFKAICAARRILQYSKVRKFYARNLGIDTPELLDLTWHGVLDKLIPAMNKLQLDGYQNVDELIIYQRILRFDNYMIAMMNRGIISYKYTIPCFGEYNFFLKLFQKNLERILFRWNFLGFNLFGWRFFDDQEKFVVGKSEPIKNYTTRFQMMCVCLAIVQGLVAVPLLMWNVLMCTFRYGWVAKRDPSRLAARVFTPSAKLRLRHLNELKHESKARYNQALCYVNSYLDTFSGSPFKGILDAASLLAQGLYIYIVGGYLLFKGQMNENMATDLFHVYVLDSVCQILYSLYSKDPKVTSRSEFMKTIIAKLTYVPDRWESTRGRTESTRAEVARQFPRKWKIMVADILSPITTVGLLLHLCSRAYEILHFMRENTVKTDGAGYVCSYSTLDLEAHGSFRWMEETPAPGWKPQQSARGKVEFSLHNFCLNNPKWRIPVRFRPGLESIRRILYPDVDDLEQTYASASSLVQPSPRVHNYPSKLRYPRTPHQDHEESYDNASLDGQRTPNGSLPLQEQTAPSFPHGVHFQTNTQYDHCRRQMNPPEFWFHPQPPMNEHSFQRTDHIYRTYDSVHSPPRFANESKQECPQIVIHPPTDLRKNESQNSFSNHNEHSEFHEDNLLMKQAEDMLLAQFQDQATVDPLNNSNHLNAAEPLNNSDQLFPDYNRLVYRGDRLRTKEDD